MAFNLFHQFERVTETLAHPAAQDFYRLLERLSQAARTATPDWATYPTFVDYAAICFWAIRKLEYSFVAAAFSSFEEDQQVKRPLAVLDVGCGVVPLCNWMSRRGHHVTAIDPLAADIAFAVTNDLNAFYQSQVNYQVASGEQLPFPDASFDIVTCVSVLEHLAPGNDRLTLYEIARVLKPEGRLLITFDVAPSPATEADDWPTHLRKYAYPFSPEPARRLIDHISDFFQIAPTDLPPEFDALTWDQVHDFWRSAQSHDGRAEPVREYLALGGALKCRQLSPSARPALSLSPNELSTAYREGQQALQQQLSFYQFHAAERLRQLDNYSTQFKQITAQLAESEADRTARLEVIQAQVQQIGHLNNLQQRWAEIEAERSSHFAALEQKEQQLIGVQAQLGETQDKNAELETALTTHLADIQAQARQIQDLKAHLSELKQGYADKEVLLDEARTNVAELQERNTVLEMSQDELGNLRWELDIVLHDHERLSASIGKWSNRSLEQSPLLKELQANYSVIAEERNQGFEETSGERKPLALEENASGVPVGLIASPGTEQLRYAVQQRQKSAVMYPPANSPRFPGKIIANPAPAAPKIKAVLKCVVVDLTLILPGNESGGLKVFALELIRQLSRLAPDLTLKLLTYEGNHEELAWLDSANVKRICVGKQIVPPNPSSLLCELQADLLFCPYIIPLFLDPKVPTVCCVADVQYIYYPQFFDQQNLYWRDYFFRESCRWSQRIVTLSEHARRTILENSGFSPERVTAIHIPLSNKLEEVPSYRASEIISRWELENNHFLLYPSNFWEHKNHQTLFTAFETYLCRHPKSSLSLVCTGADVDRMRQLKQDVREKGLEGKVIFPGYVTKEELAALMQSCRALIFPSLYEGFGMPVLEAMNLGKPVLCSNATSLPEVVGDAAIFFNPQEPNEIADAIEQLETDSSLAPSLVQRGYNRVAQFGGLTETAEKYLRMFSEVVNEERYLANAVRGIYTDGWICDRIIVSYSPGEDLRHFELVVSVPTWLPAPSLTITLTLNGDGDGQIYQIGKGEMAGIYQMLSPEGGFLELWFSPAIQPGLFNGGTDDRVLSGQAVSCRIIDSSGTVDLLSIVDWQKG